MYQAIIARIKTKPHPNADRIQLADVCGTTVVVGLNHTDGELGVYFPSDGVLSHEFCLANNLYNKSARAKLGLPDGPIGFFDHHRRVRTQGFRGQKSDGFWLPLEALYKLIALTPMGSAPTFEEGFMFDTLNGHQLCEKWTTRKVSVGGTPKTSRKLELLSFPKHVDTEQWDYYWKDIPDGSLLTITEKIHGTSHRVGLVKTPKAWWQFWKPTYNYVHGSRNVVLTAHSGRTSYYGTDKFRFKAVGTPPLRTGEVVYGELVGFVAASSSIMPAHTCDKKELPDVYQTFGPHVFYHYGQADGHAEFIVYRIVQFNEAGEGTELSHPQVVRRAGQLGFRTVPLLQTMVFDIRHKDELNLLVNSHVGEIYRGSVLAPNQLAEGVVIRVDTPDGHTQFLKKKSYAFKLLEGIIKSTDGYEDVEENA